MTLKVGSVQLSSSTEWVVEGLGEGGGAREGRFGRDLLPVFSAGGPCEQFWHGQGYLLFDVVNPAFPLPATASPIPQGVLAVFLLFSFDLNMILVNGKY